MLAAHQAAEGILYGCGKSIKYKVLTISNAPVNKSQPASSVTCSAVRKLALIALITKQTLTKKKGEVYIPHNNGLVSKLMDIVVNGLNREYSWIFMWGITTLAFFLLVKIGNSAGKR